MQLLLSLENILVVPSKSRLITENKQGLWNHLNDSTKSLLLMN